MKKSLDKARPRNSTWRYLLGYVPLILSQLFVSIKVKGRRNVPKTGPYIIAANHFSTADPFYILAGIMKPISFLMASDQDVEWHLAWAPWLYGFIPTDRKNLKPGTIKQAVKTLKNNEILGLFPEGDTLKNTLRPAKRGAAYLASVSGVRILPVSVLGSEDMWNHLGRGVRPRVMVKIGKPFYPAEIDKNRDKKPQLDEIGNDIMKKISKLLPKERCGVFE